MRLIAAVCLTSVALASQAPPDFSGRWRLDTGQSTAIGGGAGMGRGSGTGGGGGLGLGPPPPELYVVQSESTMTIEQRGSPVAKVVYRLDGKESRGRLPAGQATREATFTSRWQNGRLVTTIETVTPRGGRLTYEETRYLADTGELVVELGNVAGINARRTVYRRIGK